MAAKILTIHADLRCFLDIPAFYLDQLVDIQTRHAIGDPCLQFVQDLALCKARFPLPLSLLAGLHDSLFGLWRSAFAQYKCVPQRITAALLVLSSRPLKLRSGVGVRAGSCSFAKFGRCTVHPQCQMVPHLLKRGQCRGQLRLFCRRWFNFRAHPSKRCWVSRALAPNEFKLVPRHLRAQYAELQAA